MAERFPSLSFGFFRCSSFYCHPFLLFFLSIYPVFFVSPSSHFTKSALHLASTPFHTSGQVRHSASLLGAFHGVLLGAPPHGAIVVHTAGDPKISCGRPAATRLRCCHMNPRTLVHIKHKHRHTAVMHHMELFCGVLQVVPQNGNPN